MVAERETYADLLIAHLSDPMVLFEIQRKASSTDRFTIGQIADRALTLYLAKWANEYSWDELAEKVNYHPTVLRDKLKKLSGNGQNPETF